jgi:Ni/Fe-hydrogenase subunit HybB-like protein
VRTGVEWRVLFFATVVLKWAVPFGLLLSRAGKRSLAVLTLAACSALLGHWLDLYVMIVPGVLLDRPMPGLLEVGLALCVGTVCVWILRFPGLSTTGRR